MDSDEVLQQDVILFRRFMRVMTLLRNQHRIQPHVLPTPSISHSPSLDSGDVESQDDGSDDEDGESWESDSDSEMDEVAMDERDDDMDNGNFNNDDNDDRDKDDDSVGTIETDELNNYLQEPQQASGLNQETTIQPPTRASSSPDPIQTTDNNTDLCCWDHGCDGRRFTTLSNLRRHRRERLRTRPVWRCSRCGATFSRTTARNTHVARGSCNRIRRYSNGRRRPVPRVDD